MSLSTAYPVVLTIAGSDSGGGAGVQADMKTMTALDGFATSVIAALTAQNGAAVLGIHEVPADFVALQLRAVLDGFPVRAAKTGMLFSPAIIEAVAQALAGKAFPLVVDPVCVSQSGHRLLREDAVEVLLQRLLPLADLVTPNRPEAEVLTGLSIGCEKDVAAACDRLLAMGAKAVLIKGGHFAQTSVLTDWLALPDRPLCALQHARVDTPNNHGTGCTLAAAIAAMLAHGRDLEDAVRGAQDYLVRALGSSFTPGIGAGPPNFMGGREGC